MFLFGLRRIGLCFALVYLCWDLKPVFYAIWSPFTFLMGYNDPRKPTNDYLHGVPARACAFHHMHTFRAPGSVWNDYLLGPRLCLSLTSYVHLQGPWLCLAMESIP